MTREEELLPCPFCGSADVVFVDADDDDGRFAAVGCNGRGAGSRQHYYCGEDAKAYAADAWNRRSTLSDPILAARVEELEKALEEIADLCPTTQEACLASTMGQIAIAALSSQGAEDGK